MSDLDIWAQIVAMPRPHRVVDFPRNKDDGTPVARVAVVVLTQEEQILCSVETERFTRKALKEVPKSDEARRGYDDTYNNQGVCELLFRACKKPDELSKPFFPSATAIREHLSPDEVAVLFRSYALVQDEVGPIIARLSDEECEAWVRRLQEAGSHAPLAFLSSGALTALAFSMASRMPRSATPNTSPGSPPDDGSPPAAES